jgi:hypothetical protein
LSHGAESDHESQIDDSGDSETSSNNSGCLNVAAVAALARICCDFGPSNIPKTHIGSMESYTRYVPSAESVLKTQANEAIIFEDFSLPGFVCRCIRSLWTSCANSRCNYTI